MTDFQITHKVGNARRGKLNTKNGTINTPAFMPVGTAATVKAVFTKDLYETNSEIILGNTYHLMLRPGSAQVKEFGGLHKFMNWNKPILTDSGGYQVFSLSKNVKIMDEGVQFYSHIDGSKHLFTPESVVQIQRKIGSDICMVLDECLKYPCEYSYASQSLNLTHNWLERSIEEFNKTEILYNKKQFLFPIVQGSTFKDLRTKSAEYVSNKNMVGNAIGGLSVGEPKEIIYENVL